MIMCEFPTLFVHYPVLSVVTGKFTFAMKELVLDLTSLSNSGFESIQSSKKLILLLGIESKEKDLPLRLDEGLRPPASTGEMQV